MIWYFLFNQLGLQASLEDDARWLVHIPLAVILKPLGLGIHKKHVILKALENKDAVRNFLAIQNLTN